MTALITGASSGIGRDMARSLAKRGINVIITARRKDRLFELRDELTEKYGIKVKPIAADLADRKQCIALYERVKKYNIDIFINNAGFGVFGELTDTDLDRELEELDVNICAFHILFKLFLKDFKKRGGGFILNVGSIAGFMPGPMFSSYYASKSYIVRMTQSVIEELRAQESPVKVSLLCPGPIATEFMERARVSFAVPPQSSGYVAEYAIRELLRGKHIIIPSCAAAIVVYGSKLVPDCALAFIARKIQGFRDKL